MAASDTLDELGEVDAIEGLPTPRRRDNLVGHAAAEQALLEAYRSGRIHHGWLIGGPKGIGKATLAYRFARFVLSNPDPAAAAVAAATDLSVAPENPAAHRIAAGAHPDLLTLARRYDPEKKRVTSGIPVDDVRRCISFFGSTAAEGGWRIAIVDSADDMNASAANAVLKILEEPPPRALFLVVSHAPGRLLPTIRSRCRALTLEPLSPEEIGTGLDDFGIGAGTDPADLPLVSGLAEGSLRRAVTLLQGDGIALYRAFRRISDRLPVLDVAETHAFAESVTKRGAEESYTVFLDLMRDWLWRRVRGLPEPDGAPGAAATTPLIGWAEAFESITRSAGIADGYNLDKKAVVLAAFRALSQAAAGRRP